jgi:hypothetical protein
MPASGKEVEVLFEKTVGQELKAAFKFEVEEIQ